MEKRAKQSNSKDCCCVERALGYLYVRNDDFAKAAEAFKKVIENKASLQANDITMAAYVFEQVGELELAQKVREEGLRNAMSIKESENKTKKTAENPTALLEQKS